MSFLSRIFPTLFQKSISQKSISHTWKAFQSFISGDDNDSEWSYNDRVKLGYMGTDIVFSAVDIVASAFASVPLSAVIVDSEGVMQKKLPANHPLNRLLKKPNIFQNQSEWLYAVSAFRTLGGTGYTFMDTGDPSDYSQPVYLWPLAPPCAELRAEAGRMWWEFSPAESACMNWMFNRLPIDIDGTSNIVDWKAFSPESITQGMSSLKSADLAAEIYRYGNLWNKTYFKHGSRPSHAFINETKDANNNPVFLEDDQYNALKTMISQVYSGMQNGNGKAILLEHVKPIALSQSPKDADFIESHKQFAADVARTAKVPPILLNQGEGTTFDNMKEAKLSMWDDTIIPLVKSHAEELTEDLARRYGDNIAIMPDFSGVSALESRRQSQWERADASDDLTINEKRAMKGLEPIDGGDVLFIDANKIPLSVASSLGINGLNE